MYVCTYVVDVCISLMYEVNVDMDVHLEPLDSHADLGLEFRKTESKPHHYNNLIF